MNPDEKNRDELYLQFLTDLGICIKNRRPAGIAAVLISKDGTIDKFYFDCGINYKILAASIIHKDAIFEEIKNNPQWLREVMEEDNG